MTGDTTEVDEAQQDAAQEELAKDESAQEGAGEASESAQSSDPGAAPGSDAEQVAIKPLSGSGASGQVGEIDLDALMDVPVTLSVEIGKKRMPIKDLISLTPGSIVELDRDLNAPLDLLVNGTLIARGEVVVVDKRFGLRLVDIVSPQERLQKLK